MRDTIAAFIDASRDLELLLMVRVVAKVLVAYRHLRPQTAAKVFLFLLVVEIWIKDGHY